MFDLEEQKSFQSKADMLLPKLRHWEVCAKWLVIPIQDKRAWQGYRMERNALDAYLANTKLHSGDSLIVELPETAVGRLRFDISSPGNWCDSPCRFKITLGEMPMEVINADAPYNGTLSCTWLEQEIVNIDDVPGQCYLTRRFSCRFIRIDVVKVPRYVQLSRIRVEAEGVEEILPPAPVSLPPDLLEIDRTAIRTLRNCMQTVFEDGPKRDRRAWIGDIRLQAMVNLVSYKRFDIVERCIYLFAGNLLPDGEIPGCILERPVSLPGCHTHDYALLFAVLLEEHCRWSGNLAIGEELFELAAWQFTLMERFFKDGLFEDPCDSPMVNWFFIDHDLKLDRQASMQGIAICCLKSLTRLAKMLGKSSDAQKYSALAAKLTHVARKKLYNPQRKLIESGPSRQISYASQIWMVLAEVLDKKESLHALQAVSQLHDAIYPSSPYMLHYMLEAYEKCGDHQHLLALVREYWGGMIQNGADTFWEAYRPNEPFFSPYNDVRMNSACHAWSTTPAYFLRRLQLADEDYMTS